MSMSYSWEYFHCNINRAATSSVFNVARGKVSWQHTTRTAKLHFEKEELSSHVDPHSQGVQTHKPPQTLRRVETETNMSLQSLFGYSLNAVRSFFFLQANAKYVFACAKAINKEEPSNWQGCGKQPSCDQLLDPTCLRGLSIQIQGSGTVRGYAIR